MDRSREVAAPWHAVVLAKNQARTSTVIGAHVPVRRCSPDLAHMQTQGLSAQEKQSLSGHRCSRRWSLTAVLFEGHLGWVLLVCAWTGSHVIHWSWSIGFQLTDLSRSGEVAGGCE